MNTHSDNPQATVAAVGMFDGVHLGHCSVLDRLSAEARSRSMQSLALTFSRHPLELVDAKRAPHLITDTATRITLLRSGGIDRAETLDFTPELRALSGRAFLDMLHRRYGVRVLVMGYDNHIGSDRLDAAAAAVLTPCTGIEIVQVDERTIQGTGSLSSTSIRNALATGNVTRAACILGRYYTVEGTVTSGNRLGRTIGFPTANIDTPSDIIIAEGAYAVDVTIDGDSRRMRGMANIGRRPTLGKNGERRLEVNIFDFSADIYGRRLRIEFLQLLRDETQFASLDDLKQQLTADRQAATSVRRMTNFNLTD